ncbi:MAG TPA: fructosamine kinase family protein [Tepidisphaeraceae bacterium]|nr:fructosamine kinase family protein [Tepidisphaeraceae bacterium]
MAVANRASQIENRQSFMTPHEVEVSWQDLRQIVREWAGSAAELDEVTPLAGGAINTTLRLHTKGEQKAVLKITPHRVDRAYADEQHQLQLLREVGIPVPEIYRCKIGSLENPFSYLLMEFVEGIDLGAAKVRCGAEEFDQIQQHLAELVLLMHERRSPHYMRVTAAEPKHYENWPQCYRDVFDPIWRDLEKSPAIPVKARKTMAKIHDRLDRLLLHDDCPRLVHWDIWATNVLARPDADGRWRVAALLDPNCKYAHAEAEIAYLELFHTATPAFMKAYQQQHRLPPEYHQMRRQIYQLYSLLNHLHLFGQEYLKAYLAMLERVGTIV